MLQYELSMIIFQEEIPIFSYRNCRGLPEIYHSVHDSLLPVVLLPWLPATEVYAQLSTPHTLQFSTHSEDSQCIFSHLVQYTNTQEHLIALRSRKYIGAYGSYFNHNTSTSADKIWEILEYYILVQTLATTVISRIWRRVC